MDEAAHGGHGKPEPGRALVAAGLGHTASDRGGLRPLATFLAQVMACEARVPEFRQYRRAPPCEASARYASAQQRWRA